jgi:hydrogenase-4 component E
MSMGAVDLVLLIAVLLDLYVLASSRLSACIRALAWQGGILALLPILVGGTSLHTALMAGGSLVIKALVIPHLLQQTIQTANVRREVEPYVSLHLSVLFGGALVGCAFWLSTVLVLPETHPLSGTLLIPAAFATLFLGFFILVSRRKAVTQVIGYLMLENGIFIFGQLLAHQLPLAVELGILLDLLVGVFVFGIAIHHIQDTFEHIDTHDLSSLKD